MTPPPPGDTGPDGEQFADGRGRYRLDSRIATGGMGEVWRATDTLLGRQVAVKLLKHEFADDATFRSRFADEAQHAAALDHPGVAAVYDVGEAAPGGGSTTPRPFLVMELVDGEPLSTLLRQGRDGGRAIDRDVLRDLLAQAATAIGAAHAAGIVHRDVKPANLLVTRDRRIKITDFGIARAADAVGITQTGQVMGTPQYLSPEQARGEAATPASDVYALGVVAFECLAGRRPFEADSPVATALAHLQQPVPDLPDDVPADLAAVVRTALAKDPAARYPNGSAFADALREPATAVLPGGMAAAALAGGAFGAAEGGTRVMPAAGATPPPPSTLETPVAAPPPAKSGESRSRVLLAVVGAIVLALVALGLVFALRGGDGTTPPPAEPSSRAPTSASTEPTPTQDPTTEAPTPTPTPTPTTAAPTTEAPDTVTINGSDYVGAQVDGVSAQLSELGLNVQRSEIPNDGSGAQGEVTDVSPDGELEVGSSVTVTFLGAPAAPTETSTPSESVPSPSQTTEAPGNSGDSNSGNGGGNGNADGPVVPAPTPSTTSPSVPPAPAASPAATPAPGATASPGVDPGVDPGSLPTGAAG